MRSLHIAFQTGQKNLFQNSLIICSSSPIKLSEVFRNGDVFMSIEIRTSKRKFNKILKLWYGNSTTFMCPRDQIESERRKDLCWQVANIDIFWLESRRRK